MPAFRLALILSGAFATVVIGIGSHTAHAPALVAMLEAGAEAARKAEGGTGVGVSFRTAEGWLTRHALLAGGDSLDEQTRGAVAAAIASVPGVGGVRWQAGEVASVSTAPNHCQEVVEAILKTRTIRFGEASAAIDPASEQLLDEVAAALRPCGGSIIAITGHTDSGGDEGANLALSQARAEAVRWALVGRGIPRDGLRAAGKGAKEPVEGLEPSDPANRRIEFSVIETAPVRPTPIDTPGPG